jgi:uncharacterized protein
MGDLGNYLAVAIAGGLCGLVNSIAGGGSLILFPVLLWVGLPSLDANVTNSVATWPGYVGGVGGFRDEIREQRYRLPRLLIATVAGSLTGCVLLLLTPSGAFDVIVPFLVLAAAGLTAIQPVVRRRLAKREDDGRPPGLSAVAGIFFATIYGGYFGAALGVIVLAVLGLTIHETLRQLNATKAVISLVDCTVSVVVFGLFGPVHWDYVAVAAPLTLVGGYVGARVARKINENLLRISVVTLGVIVALVLFIQNA